MDGHVFCIGWNRVGVFRPVGGGGNGAGVDVAKIGCRVAGHRVSHVELLVGIAGGVGARVEREGCFASEV